MIQAAAIIRWGCTPRRDVAPEVADFYEICLKRHLRRPPSASDCVTTERVRALV
jgi:hypothetical protein